jgi:hypothetical protein
MAGFSSKEQIEAYAARNNIHVEQAVDHMRASLSEFMRQNPMTDCVSPDWLDGLHPQVFEQLAHIVGCATCSTTVMMARDAKSRNHT